MINSHQCQVSSFWKQGGNNYGYFEGFCIIFEHGNAWASMGSLVKIHNKRSCSYKPIQYIHRQSSVKLPPIKIFCQEIIPWLKVPNQIRSAVVCLPKHSHEGYGNFFPHWYLYRNRYCVSSLKMLWKVPQKKIINKFLTDNYKYCPLCNCQNSFTATNFMATKFMATDIYWFKVPQFKLFRLSVAEKSNCKCCDVFWIS